MTHRITTKDKILSLLREGTPMLSLDMARVLKLDKGTTSQTAKELHDAGLLHIIEWRCNPKNGGNKVYAYGAGKDVTKPESKFASRDKTQEVYVPKVFVPRPDEAAAWLRNPI